MRAHAVDRAAVQNENQICILDGRDALGDDELRRLRDLGAQRSADLRVGFRIDGRGRIVEDSHGSRYWKARCASRRRSI